MSGRIDEPEDLAARAGQDLRGSAPAATSKDLLQQLVTDMREVRDFVVAQREQKIPDRINSLERWQRWVIGFSAGVLSIEAIRTVVSYAVPSVARAITGH